MESLVMTDEFSNYYSKFIDCSYECVDRIVINAYYPLCCAPAGFRHWWRLLKGSDDDLDNAHLMRFASRISRRVRAYAKNHNIPVIDCRSKERKHEIAKDYLPTEENFVGVFLILVSRAPAPIFDVQHSKNGKISNIIKKNPLPYVNHYYFHIMDPQWGHITIKMSGHPPFNAQIMLNGHEYVQRQAQKECLEFTKEGNCFTHIQDAHRMAAIAETLFCSDRAVGQLSQLCERWIYSSCLCFALNLDEQQRTGFQYTFSVFQAEFSRNLLFIKGAQMDQVFQSVIEHTRNQLDVKNLKTIFGNKKRPSRTKRNRQPRLEVVVEKPVYDLTVFKVHFGLITAKIYSKGERVLRVETIIHNTKALYCGRLLVKFPVIIAKLKAILYRFVNVLRCIDGCYIADNKLDDLPTPSQVGQTRVGGVDINNLRIRTVIEAIIPLAAKPRGFTSSDLAEAVQSRQTTGDNEYSSRKAAYDLKKFRGKNIIRKIENSRRYEPTPEGIKMMAALLVIREKIIKPVLAGAGKPKRGPKPKNLSPVNKHYKNLQSEMHSLFLTIGIAV